MADDIEELCRIFIVTYGEHDLEGQLHVIITDEGIVTDLYDKDGDKLVASAYHFADDLVQYVH